MAVQDLNKWSIFKQNPGVIAGRRGRNADESVDSIEVLDQGPNAVIGSPSISLWCYDNLFSPIYLLQ